MGDCLIGPFPVVDVAVFHADFSQSRLVSRRFRGLIVVYTDNQI